MPVRIEGYVDNGRGAPAAGIPAVATRLSDGVVVDTTVTDADGYWLFTGLAPADEHLVTLTDTAGNAVARAPWSGELREAYVRDRLEVAGKPVLIDVAAGNALLWSSTGLYAPQAPVTDLSGYYTKSEADARYPQKTDVDPYPNYLTLTEADARYPLKTDLDPYPTYLTAAEADALFLTPAEGNAAYATSAHNHDAAYIQLAGGSVMTGLLGPTTTNTRDLGTTALRWRKLWAVDGEFTNAPTVGGSALLTATTADALFLTPAEGNAAYATAAHNHDATYVQLVGGSVMTGLLGPTTNNTRDLGTTALRWRKLWGVDADLSGALTVTTGPLTVSAGGIAVTGASTFSVAPTVGGSSLLTATAGDTAYVNVGGDTMTGNLTMTATAATIEIGSTAGANAPIIDFHSSGNANDFDSRIIASGGAAGVGLGTLALTAATVTVSAALQVNSRPVAMAGCRAYHNANQSIATATLTVLAFNSERYDTDAYHDLVTNNSRLTVPAGLAGKYLITAHVNWAANADANERAIGIRLGGTTFIAYNNGPGINVAGIQMHSTATTVYDLAVGNYIEITVFQASGVALNVLASANYSPEVTMTRVA